jgi:hypothetical protein
MQVFQRPSPVTVVAGQDLADVEMRVGAVTAGGKKHRRWDFEDGAPDIDVREIEALAIERHKQPWPSLAEKLPEGLEDDFLVGSVERLFFVALDIQKADTDDVPCRGIEPESPDHLLLAGLHVFLAPVYALRTSEEDLDGARWDPLHFLPDGLDVYDKRHLALLYWTRPAARATISTG